MSEFTEIFYTFLITSLIGLILAISKLCYKSKCKEINLCCLKIIRDVEGEEKLDIEQTTKEEEEKK
jgi:Flp pilus assembly protein protease CpaA